MTNTHEDEIDLFELFEAIWDGKWIVSFAILMTILAGFVFLFFYETEYEAKLNYSVDTIPPFYDGKKAFADFEKRFYSKSEFEYWKKSSGNTSLLFEDFSATEVVDGFVVSKNENELLAALESQNNSGSFVLIRANQLSILDDFFQYTNHINEVLKNEYVLRARDELKIIESRFKDLGSADTNIVKTVLSIDRFIVSAEQGAKVFVIQRPTMPKNVSPSLPLVLSISVVLGGMIGSLWIFVRIAIRKRRQKLAQT